MKHRYVEIIASLLILIFVYTGISKLIELERFRIILSLSPLISWAAGIVSWALPVIEIMTAILLLVPSLRKWGLISSFFLMSLFTLYIAYMIFLAADRSCSCGGVLEKMTWTDHLIFNIVFTLLAGLGLWLSDKSFIAINRRSRKPV